jgi:hypothetical protein
MKTTTKQFNIFKSEARKWIDVFGLKGWRIDFFHLKLENNDRGQARVNISGRCVSIMFGKEWDGECKDFDIKQTAFHEVCELLLWKLADMAHTKVFTNRDSITEETHSVIRILENVLFRDSIKEK